MLVRSSGLSIDFECFLLDLQEAATAAVCCQRTIRFFESIGFPFVVLLDIDSEMGTEPKTYVSDSSGWSEYYEKYGLAEKDPLLQAIMVQKGHDFIWSKFSLSLERSSARIFHDAKSFGLEEGFTFAFFSKQGRTLILTVAASDNLFSKMNAQQKGMLVSSAKLALLRLSEIIEQRAQVRMGEIKLSTRQIQVMALLKSGLSNKEIANQLQLSDGTIEYHVSNLLKVFGAPDRKVLIRKLTLNRVDEVL